jgi:hypothetical protein
MAAETVPAPPDFRKRLRDMALTFPEPRPLGQFLSRGGRTIEARSNIGSLHRTLYNIRTVEERMILHPDEQHLLDKRLMKKTVRGGGWVSSVSSFLPCGGGGLADRLTDPDTHKSAPPQGAAVRGLDRPVEKNQAKDDAELLLGRRKQPPAARPSRRGSQTSAGAGEGATSARRLSVSERLPDEGAGLGPSSASGPEPLRPRSAGRAVHFAAQQRPDEGPAAGTGPEERLSKPDRVRFDWVKMSSPSRPLTRGEQELLALRKLRIQKSVAVLDADSVASSAHTVREISAMNTLGMATNLVKKGGFAVSHSSALQMEKLRRRAREEAGGAGLDGDLGTLNSRGHRAAITKGATKPRPVQTHRGGTDGKTNGSRPTLNL